MTFDLIVKNGMIVDGSGLPRYRGDVAVKDGKIAEIGRLDGVATRETLDAEGHVVSPGFVDGHTHMDAQIFWDPIGTSSCYQGVTSVVMGNCGSRSRPAARPRPIWCSAISSAPRISAAPPCWPASSGSGRRSHSCST